MKPEKADRLLPFEAQDRRELQPGEMKLGELDVDGDDLVGAKREERQGHVAGARDRENTAARETQGGGLGALVFLRDPVVVEGAHAAASRAAVSLVGRAGRI